MNTTKINFLGKENLQRIQLEIGRLIDLTEKKLINVATWPEPEQVRLRAQVHKWSLLILHNTLMLGLSYQSKDHLDVLVEETAFDDHFFETKLRSFIEVLNEEQKELYFEEIRSSLNMKQFVRIKLQP